MVLKKKEDNNNNNNGDDGDNNINSTYKLCLVLNNWQRGIHTLSHLGGIKWSYKSKDYSGYPVTSEQYVLITGRQNTAENLTL